MARKNDDLADSFAADESGGWLSGLLADEETLDRRGKWRLAVWAAGSVSAVVIAFMAAQTATERRHEQTAAADLARQSQLIQRLAKESHSETSRLAAAIDTLNSDRDRMFNRLGTLEQGLDSVTGSISRVQAPAAAAIEKPAADKPAVEKTANDPAAVATAAVEARPADAKPAPAAPQIAAIAQTVAPVARATPAGPPPSPATPAPAAAAESAVPPLPVARDINEARKPKSRETSRESPSAAFPPAVALMPPKSILAPPDPAASRLMEAPVASDQEDAAAVDTAEPTPIPVRRVEFGVDLGGANSVDGLRTLWLRLAKRKELKGLHPIIAVKDEGRGGTRLRLVAGPLTDAAAAARLCAELGIADRNCETSVYEGQRLPEGTPAAPRPRKRVPRVATTTEDPSPAPALPPPAAQQSSLSSLFGAR